LLLLVPFVSLFFLFALLLDALRKAGRNQCLVLLAFIPFVAPVMLFALTFSHWPERIVSQPESPAPSFADWREGIMWGPREVVQGIALAAAAVILIPVAALVVAAAAGIDVTDSKRATEVSLAASLPFEAALFAIVVALTVFKYHSRWSDLGFRPLALKQAWVPAAIVVATFVTVYVYGVIADAIGGNKFLPKSTLGEDVFDEKAFVVLAGVLALAMAPLVEETFFRGFVFGGLSKRFSFFGAALISGFLFSLAHGQPTTLIPFTVVGMLFAAGYAYTGSLWTTIAAHFTFNLISFTVTLATR
jgi:membrane protease YdiL (CAAX protease family)